MNKEHNYKEEFQVLTEEELFLVFSGETELPAETKLIAEEELKKRGFDFENMPLNKLRWELAELKEEIAKENGKGMVLTSSKYSTVFIAVFGLGLALIIAYNMYAGMVRKEDLLVQFIMLGIGLGLCVWGIINFAKRKKRETERERRIAEVEKMINGA
jgi:hypothetical protein